MNKYDQVRNLLSLTIAELEQALLLGEGTKVKIREIDRRTATNEIWLMTTDGNFLFPTSVMYDLIAWDDCEHEDIEMTCYVRVTERGIEAQF